MEPADQMRELIKLGKFEEAYELGKDPLSDPKSYVEIIKALTELAAELRKMCM